MTSAVSPRDQADLHLMRHARAASFFDTTNISSSLLSPGGLKAKVG